MSGKIIFTHNKRSIFIWRFARLIRNCLLQACVAVFLVGSALAGETIDIAAVYALTGAAAENNAFSLEGIYFGVNEINDAGGLLGKKIRILEFDNQSTPIGSSLAAEKAFQSGAAAILGAAWSSHSLAVAKIAQEKKIPMITNVSTNPSVTEIGDYIFRICFTDAFQGRALAKFVMQDLSARTAVVFVDVTSDYSLKLSEIFRQHFEQAGGRVLLELEYKLRQMPLEREIRQAAVSNADVIFIPGHDESGTIADMLQNAGTGSILLGGDGWATEAFLTKGGRKLQQGYYCTHWSTQLETPESNRFTRKYIRSEISAANIALGYDAMMLLADAINRAGSSNREKIRQAIADTRAFKGVTGCISLDEKGDPNKGAVVMEIRNGKPYYLKVLNP